MRSEQTGDRISLEGMRFYGYHGCLPEERARGQVFLVDVVLTLPLAAAGASDDLAATVNYAEVFALARSVVEGAPCRLIEAVAERIARGVLARFARVEEVRVTVHKPAAPLPGLFRDAAVTVVRARDAEARA
ncbi:dihydroneopterin aldolase [uncultured Selenomonas sp.]|uniref:dihydroneopterin aldolase n=1 Tax=uncultured Selenomonas sp. TaxID=159275 RepID=UPI00280461A3|nr:dihydroneopterin aldolase [uncultured Selenomonas sp.]